MAAVASLDAAFREGLAKWGVSQGAESIAPPLSVLSLGWPELEKFLPDQGLPRGVIELAAPMTKEGAMRGGATTIALRAVAKIHEKEERSWCAWITPNDAPSLYAPAVAQAGVDLERLLVVRPDAGALARTAVKTAAAGAFDLVVIDAFSGLDGKLGSSSRAPREQGAVVVRKLALAAEEKGTTFLLLTNAYAPRPVPWPVALRMEVERRPEALALRITKDRRGRSSSQHVVRLAY